MRLKKYITELSMKKGTNIEYKKGHFFGQRIAKITLESGDKFTAYFSTSEDLTMNHPAIRLGITFEDEYYNLAVSPKSSKVALQLFAALEVVFKKMIAEMEHDFILFTGDVKHQKLYDAIAKRIGKTGKYINKSIKSSGQYIFIKKGSNII